MAYGAFADVYDALTGNVGYPARAAYITRLLAAYGVRDGLLLDLACGTGSLSVELSKSGFEVIASDASPEMLTVARDKAAAAGEDILFLCQRMEETDLFGSVRAVVCSLDSINHLPHLDAVSHTLQNLVNFLDDGGLIVFDVNTVYKHQNVLADNTFVYDTGDVFCVWQNHLCPDGRTVDLRLDFFHREGDRYRRGSECFRETAFTDDELTRAAESAGYAVRARYADLTDNAPAADTERVYYVLQLVRR